MNKIQVVLVDDQTIMRDGLKTILETDDAIEVVGMAANGKEALELAHKLNPTIFLMDIRMPEMNGVEATQLIKSKYPDSIVLMLTTFDDDDYIMDALTYGASGYLLKDIDGEQLIQAVHDAIKGNLIMPGRIAAKLVAKLNESKRSGFTNTPPRIEGLKQFSEKEIEIIASLMSGKNNKEIAESLYLSEGTIKNYVSTIYSKIHVNNRTNAVIYFKSIGL